MLNDESGVMDQWNNRKTLIGMHSFMCLIDICFFFLGEPLLNYMWHVGRDMHVKCKNIACKMYVEHGAKFTMHARNRPVNSGHLCS